jgi:hypothetical protein
MKLLFILSLQFLYHQATFAAIKPTWQIDCKNSATSDIHLDLYLEKKLDPGSVESSGGILEILGDTQVLTVTTTNPLVLTGFSDEYGGVISSVMLPDELLKNQGQPYPIRILYNYKKSTGFGQSATIDVVCVGHK